MRFDTNSLGECWARGSDLRAGGKTFRRIMLIEVVLLEKVGLTGKEKLNEVGVGLFNGHGRVQRFDGTGQDSRRRVKGKGNWEQKELDLEALADLQSIGFERVDRRGRNRQSQGEGGPGEVRKKTKSKKKGGKGNWQFLQSTN